MEASIALSKPGSAAAAPASKFLTQLQKAALRHGHAESAAAHMVDTCRRFILFHGTKHPQEMGRSEVSAYLQHIAKTQKDPLRGIATAHAALEFLYATFLQRDLGDREKVSGPFLGSS